MNLLTKSAELNGGVRPEWMQSAHDSIVGAADKLNAKVNQPEVQDTLKSILASGAIGGLGGGALMSYVASNNKPTNETPSDRRRRILRNAMIGTTLGGIAGAAIPTGINMLKSPYVEGRDGISPAYVVDDVASAALQHGAALGVGGYGLHKINQNVTSSRSNALTNLFRTLKGKGLGKNVTSPEKLEHLMHTDAGVKKVLTAFNSAGSGNDIPGGYFRANEAIQATGHPGAERELLKNLAGGAVPTARPNHEGRRANYARHFARQPAYRIDSHILAQVAGLGARGENLASGVAKYLRPSVRGVVPPIVQLALLGAAAFSAEAIQQRLMGN